MLRNILTGRVEFSFYIAKNHLMSIDSAKTVSKITSQTLQRGQTLILKGKLHQKFRIGIQVFNSRVRKTDSQHELMSLKRFNKKFCYSALLYIEQSLRQVSNMQGHITHYFDI